jgi:phage FluMu protein Com
VSIEFHCNHCDKLVRAPDSAGGKRGKCPYCKQSVYVPMPAEEVDEIPLAPLDDADDAERQRLDAEADELAEALRREREIPGEPRGTGGLRGSGVARPEPRMPVDIEPKVVDYVIALKDAQLEEAQALVPEIRRAGDAAKETVQRLMMDEMPPAGLEDVPTPVLRGFFRKLLDQL